jgi:lipopolysaccharide biosynthesis glycosyltransferase
MPLSVMLASVAEHFSPDRELIVHIICGDATDEEKQKVRQTVNQARGTKRAIVLKWYTMDKSLLARLPISDTHHVSVDTYIRFFAAYILPAECKRVIYLDCDLVVVSDLAQLYDSTAESTSLLHAVRDMGCPCVSSKGGVSNYAELGIPADAPYFNAGVLVMDFESWRKRDLTPKLIDYAIAHGERLKEHDQEVMNALLHHEWTPLDARWNQANPVLGEKVWLEHGYSHAEWRRLRDEPHIVHFTGPDKPWMGRRAYAPRRSYFFEYLQKTPYRDTGVSFPYLESFMGKRAYYLLWRAAGRLYHNLKRKPAKKSEAALTN